MTDYDPRTVEAICDLYELCWRETIETLKEEIERW